MSCTVSSLVMPWRLVASNSTTAVFIPAGNWTSAAGVTGAKGWGEMRGRNGNLTAIPAVQLANDTHDPGTSDGVTDPTGTTAVSTGAFRYARAGYLVALSAGTTLATASIAGVVELIRS